MTLNNHFFRRIDTTVNDSMSSRDLYNTPDKICDYLVLENELERSIVQDEEFITGILWGEPRYGHPEGKVLFHIKEVMENIDKLSISPQTRQRLRIAALVHDSFKHMEDKNRPRDWSKHHSVFARKYTAQFTDDGVLLDLIELHDEAYYSWRSTHIFKNLEKGERRLKNFLDRMGENIQLYYLFFKCDTKTGDKTLAPLHWFETTIPGIRVVEL